MSIVFLIIHNALVFPIAFEQSLRDIIGRSIYSVVVGSVCLYDVSITSKLTDRAL